MVFPCLVSLTELCCIHFAYLQWFRRNLVINGFIRVLGQQEDIVLTAARNLRLPKELEPLLVKYVRPTGGHLASWLKFWLSKLPDDTLQQERICEMLFDCLVLNADGQINQRRTVQTILANKNLDNVVAFRLACISFLEAEVLKLWTLVREYFLNMIGLGIELSDSLENNYGRSSEPEEVLFWIGKCLSRENGVDISEVPHCMASHIDWYESALESAVDTDNVACFDYFKNFYDGAFEYDSVGTVKWILRSAEENCQLSSFILNFMLLNFEEKSGLFREFPREMVIQFLQWPLSQTFLQNAEEVWNLVPDADKHWVFPEVYNALIFENVVSHSGYIPRIFQSYPTYCEEHIRGIWSALWKVSPDNFKSDFLDLRIFPDFPDLHDDEFLIRFEESGLKTKLLNLFLSNVEALLELYQGETLQQSLTNVVDKYKLEDLQGPVSRYISLFKKQTIPLRMFQGNRKVFQIFNDGSRFGGKYLHYIKASLASDRNKQSFSSD